MNSAAATRRATARRFSAVAVLAWLWSAAAAVAAQEPAAPAEPTKPAAPTPTDQKDKTPSDFVRFVAVDSGGHLDTAVTTYRNKDGAEVRLFGALHIADDGYYAELEARFQRCDALLYELIGPEDYRPQKGEGGGSVIGMLQTALKSGLELAFQLDAIDYAATNFVHADMTPAEFQESMAERGETLLGLIWKMLVMGAGSKPSEEVLAANQFDIVQAFRSGEGRHKLRMAMAMQLEQVELVVAVAGGTTLLEGRNEKCLQVLQEQLKAGRKQLGIFYGAAHLPHMEQRLVNDLGFQKVDHEWLQAWDCAPRPDPKPDRELWAKRRTARADVAALAKAASLWRIESELAALGQGKPWRDRAPGFEELQAAPAAGAPPRYAGPLQDPWGRDYVIHAFPRAPWFDVQSVGPDGKPDTDDDLRSATARELRWMQRAKERGTATAGTDAEQARADLQAILAAATAFRAEHGHLPTVAELREQRGPDRKRLYDVAEKDPWGGYYRLQLLASGLRALSDGPDRQLGTADDVAVGAER